MEDFVFARQEVEIEILSLGEGEEYDYHTMSADNRTEHPGAKRAARAALVDRSACIVVTRASSSEGKEGR